MILFYIITGFVVVGLFLNFFNAKKKNNSPYFKTKKQLEDQLSLVNFTGDWQKRQEINLHLLWLISVKKVEMDRREKFGNKNDSETSWLAKLSIEDIKFTQQWKLDGLYCYPFAQEIISAYGDVLAKNEYKGAFKPDSILPVPKGFIRKAVYFTFDYFNLEEPSYIVTDKDKRADLMNGIKYYLDTLFFDTELPKSARENSIVGSAFLKNHEQHNDIQDFQLIDWRTDTDWQVKGYNYACKTLWSYAFACYDQAKKINSNNEQLRNLISITYMTKGEYHYNIGEKALAFESIKKSAELNYEEAIKWLEEHQTIERC